MSVERLMYEMYLLHNKFGGPAIAANILALVKPPRYILTDTVLT